MHSFLHAIGFSDINEKKEEEKLIAQVIEKGSERKIARISEERALCEIYMEVAEETGVVVRGEVDEKGLFHVEHYFPIHKGRNMSTCESVFINKRVDTEAYTGMCDDSRIGVSLIFYLQNQTDYVNKKWDSTDKTKYPIYLSALATDGKILLPVLSQKTELEKVKLEQKARTTLIEEAKKGNQEAMESLTIGDIDQYAIVSKRLRSEDIYSIVDTTFIPYGSESDNYTILGYIIDVRKRTNEITREGFYEMLISCNNLEFEVCINEAKLIGEPIPGRRFRGNVWMQGKIEMI